MKYRLDTLTHFNFEIVYSSTEKNRPYGAVLLSI